MVNDIREGRLRVLNRLLEDARARRELAEDALLDIIDQIAEYEQSEQALVAQIKRLESEVFDEQTKGDEESGGA
jgi:predicted  nucleic acid-binding Zn-ribbon protein